MAFTFDINLPTDRDKVRFEVGDTDASDPLVDDESIDQVLSENTNVLLVAAFIADAIASAFARKADFKNLNLSVSASQRAVAYERRVKRILRKAGVDPNGRILAGMFAGGLTISGKRAQSTDTDAVQPLFRLGDHDHPDANNPQRFRDRFENP